LGKKRGKRGESREQGVWVQRTGGRGGEKFGSCGAEDLGGGGKKMGGGEREKCSAEPHEFVKEIKGKGGDGGGGWAGRYGQCSCA